MIPVVESGGNKKHIQIKFNETLLHDKLYECDENTRKRHAPQVSVQGRSDLHRIGYLGFDPLCPLFTYLREKSNEGRWLVHN